MPRSRGSWIPSGHGSVKSYDVWILFAIALGCLLASGVGAEPIAHSSQGIQALSSKNEATSFTKIAHRRVDKCKLVRHAHDQCAFIKAHCEDTEAGLLSYLSLYYCRLADAKPFAFTILVFWLGLLFMTIGIAASDFFCVNLNTIATVLGMSENVAGVTLLALGNGSPDVFSTFAAMSSHSGSLALGELIGAACFITTVVAGSMALVQPFQVARSSFIRDVSFFILAGAFSMVFLADGRLQLWECVVMICLYLGYVCLVMFWHWKFERRKGNAGADETPQQQYLTLESGRDARTPPEAWPAYHDYFGADEQHSPRSNGPHGPSSPGRPGPNPLIRLVDEEEGGDGHHEVSLATLTSNMRVNRGVGEMRRPTLNLIRPSLMGALEFRAAMHTVKKRHSYHGLPKGMRRHSYDPGFARRAPQHQLTSASDPLLASHHGTGLAHHGLRSQSFSWSRRNTYSRRFSNAAKASSGVRAPTLDAPGSADRGRPPVSGASSPSISVSPSPSAGTLENSIPEHSGPIAPASNLLAPPPQGFLHIPNSRKRAHQTGPSDVSETKPELPKLGIPPTDASIDSRLASPFPTFTDSPMPMSVMSSPQLMAQDGPILSLPSWEGIHVDSVEERPPGFGRFAKILSSISVVLSTLFPTLSNWLEMDAWAKFLAVIAAPSVFLLTITLPVVESVEGNGDGDTEDATAVGEPIPKPADDAAKALPPSQLSLPNGGPNVFQHPVGANNCSDQSPTQPLLSHHIPHYGGLGYSNDILEERNPLSKRSSGPTSDQPHDHLSPLANEPLTVKVWNRWLVCVQIIVAPLFVALIVWANNTSDPANFRTLGYSALYTLLGSIIVLLLFLALTDSRQPPRRHFLLCFLGFIVSIAWISTIAAEVVGVLKAFGVILGISDAILGLTIFAVGNSLGDLVADITVARLGYQVMALSACFGGPLLNILLGIGIGGLYRTIHNSTRRHRRHPHDDIEYKPYELEVSTTLVISGATLLVTLVGLLVCVPLNGWRMDRKIGWGLVALWSASTIGNVVVEIAGWGGSVS